MFERPCTYHACLDREETGTRRMMVHPTEGRYAAIKAIFASVFCTTVTVSFIWESIVYLNYQDSNNLYIINDKNGIYNTTRKYLNGNSTLRSTDIFPEDKLSSKLSAISTTTKTQKLPPQNTTLNQTSTLPRRLFTTTTIPQYWNKRYSQDVQPAGIRVPNIVHYIWYNKDQKPLQFYQMLSILSAHKVLKPDVIYFHTNNEPIGPYWEYAKKLVTVKNKNPTKELFGKPIKQGYYETSNSDVDRLTVLSDHGGVYLDLDVWVLNQMITLRKFYDCVLGYELPMKNLLCGGIIVCRKESRFLQLWLRGYVDDYRIEKWAYNSGVYPSNLAIIYPDLIHIEPMRFHRPNYAELDWLLEPSMLDVFIQKYKSNFTVHLWTRAWKDLFDHKYANVTITHENYKTMNNAVGYMARTIMNGTDAQAIF